MHDGAGAQAPEGRRRRGRGPGGRKGEAVDRGTRSGRAEHAAALAGCPGAPRPAQGDRRRGGRRCQGSLPAAASRAAGPAMRRRTRGRVRALRRHMGFTQQQLSDELGTRQQTVSEWETGVYQPQGLGAPVDAGGGAGELPLQRAGPGGNGTKTDGQDGRGRRARRRAERPAGRLVARPALGASQSLV